MMVVMLILSLSLAAFAPIMTRRTKLKNSQSNKSPWSYVSPTENHIFFERSNSDTSNAIAQIGSRLNTSELSQNGINAKMLIVTNDNAPNAIQFANRSSNGSLQKTGVLNATVNRLLLGNNVGFVSGNTALFNQGTGGFTVIGHNIKLLDADYDKAIAIGNNATIGSAGTYIGTNDTQNGANVPTNSVVIGHNATAGSAQQISIGHSAGGTRNGSQSITIGEYSGQNSYSNSIVAIGANALRLDGCDETTCTTGTASGGVAIGADASRYVKGAASAVNVAIGANALKGSGTSAPNNTAYGNVAIGNDAYTSASVGSGNVAIGMESMKEADKSSSEGRNVTNNVAIGSRSLYNNLSTGNVAIGSDSLHENLSGMHNYALGTESMYSNTSGQLNIAIGTRSLNLNETGSNNIAIGVESMGESFTSTDSYSGATKLSLSNNVAVGYQSCQNLPSGASYFICIGTQSGPSANNNNVDADDRGIYIGGKSGFNEADALIYGYNPDGGTGGNGWSNSSTPGSSVVINGNLIVKGYIYTRLRSENSTLDDITSVLAIDHEVDNDSIVPLSTIGNSSLYDALNTVALKTGGYGKGLDRENYQYTSDRRLKNIQGLNDDGLEELLKLKVYNYTFKNDHKKLPHVGVIAQDLEKIFPNAVTKGEDGYLRIRWDEMFYAMVNSVKKLAAKVTGLEDTLTKLEKENRELKVYNQALEKRLTIIENKLK
jgi:hypothetical protein